MSFKFIILLLCLSLAFSVVVAQQPETDKTDKPAKTVAPPTSIQQAKELFAKAWEMEKEQKYEDALAHYNALIAFFVKQTGNENAQYTMAIFNNMGGILVTGGKYDQAIEIYKGALDLSIKGNDYKNISQFYHKLGITYDQIAKIESRKVAMKNVIRPDGKEVSAGQQILLSKGIYTRLTQIGDEFVVDRIQVGGSDNPFEKKREHYTKIVNIKVKGDFDPTQLLIPDSVEFLIQIRKKGYFTISKPQSLLAEMEYSQIDEKMVSIPRQVEPQITEDFYRQGLVNPDEIALTPVEEGKLVGKPIQVTEKEKFKPGSYQLSISKQGYDPIIENMTIYPGEGTFGFSRELKSKLRKIQYRIQSDFTALGTGQVTPDEITLNNQPIREDSVVKPAEYKLVIRKEGYEPIIKNVIIEPDERVFLITEYMKSLPREFMFQITGDYEKESITPDEVSLNGKFTKYGESVKPDAYRVVIRKKGYDSVTERVVVEPKSTPFMLEKILNSTPRRVQHYILAQFPAGLRIFPDVCTLSTKDVAGEASFKPGEYALDVKRSGYKPIQKQIKIPPDDTPYIIRETLEAKLRQVNLQVAQEVPHDDASIQPKVILVNEKTQEQTPLKDGDQIPPESYVLKIEMNGFEPEVSKELVMPSEESYKISKKLIASPRTVVTKIIAEYPIDDILVPDEITLDNKPISKDFKVKPGTHDLVIIKEGYVPVRKQIKIGANSLDYLLTERLETRSRLVNVKFTDSYDRRALSPDESSLGDNRLTPGTPLNLKPGTYALKARMKGYASLDENVLVPVGSDQYTIEKFMLAIKRDILTDISGDFDPDNKLVPDLFTLNDMPVVDKSSVKPGLFNLVLQKEGYFPILERVDIRPDPKPYLLKYRMVSKPRQLNILLKSSFGDLKIDADSLVLGTENVKDGQNIKPALKYALLIKKKGYNSLSDEVMIEPSEKPYLLKRTLEALPVLVKYEIGSDFNDQAVTPDVITLNDKAIDQKTPFVPGKYNARVEKVGYTPIKKEVLIEPSDQPYIIKETMISTPREIDLMITGDFPPGERVDAEVTLNGKDVRDTAFKPGKYQLDIAAAGYISLKEDIVIPPAEEPYHIERVLITKPRTIQEKITYDVKPPDDLPPYKITLAPVDKPKQERVVKAGDLVKPNSYIMVITKEAYETQEVKKHVWPAEAPLVLEHQLVAKQVLLRINIVYDIEPPVNLDPYSVSLIDKITGIPRFVADGKRIKPGSYFLDIQRPGYTFGARQDIEILPSEQPYHINKKLLAKPRAISFDMLDQQTSTLVPAHQILINGKPVSFKDMFQPGSEFDMVAKFKKYKTVKKRVKVIPGEGPFVENVPMQQLKKYEFSVRENTVSVDNVTYTYELYADGEKVEDHLVEIEKGVGRIYYIVWADPNAKNLQVYAGYEFTQKAFEMLTTGIGTLNNISISKLIEHLENQSKGERGHREALEILEKAIKRPKTRTSMKQCAATEIDQLMQYVEGWKDVKEAQERVRMKMVIDALDGLKK